MELVYFEVSAVSQLANSSAIQKFVFDAKASVPSSETMNLTPFGSI
jgi:hypothetical protein